MEQSSKESISLPKGSLISFMSNKVKKHGGINLAQGIPGFEPPAELISFLQEESKKSVHQYAAGNGDNDLRDLLCKKYQKYYSFEKDNFLVVNGATEAITLLFIYLKKKINSNFSTLAFSPIYETYNHVPQIFGHKSISFNLLEKEINFIELEKKIIENNVKIVYVNSPGNPYGRIWSEKEMKKIVELSEKLDFYIILDSVYKDLYFKNPVYIPLEYFSERLFYVNSFSKTFSITGWRIGYLIMHKNHVEAVRSIHDYTGLCTPSILQRAVVEYIKKSNWGEKYIFNLRENLKSSFKLLSEALRKHDFIIPKTEGGYFVWAKLPEKFKDGFEFSLDLYEKKKVATIAGVHFSDSCKNYIRFNIAHPIEKIEKAIKCIDEYMK